MLRLTELKLPLDHDEAALRDAICTALRIPPEDLLSWSVARRGYDARKRSAIHLVYSVDVSVRDEGAVAATPRVAPTPDTTYRPLASATNTPQDAPAPPVHR